MGKSFGQILWEGRYTNGHEAHEKALISLVIGEMQIETTMRYHFTSSKMAKIKRTDHITADEDVAVSGILIHCWWECKMVQPLWAKVWQFLVKSTHTYPMTQQFHA